MTEAKSEELKAKSHSVKRKAEVKYRAYDFSIEIVKFVASLPKGGVYWVVGDQLLRAATSIGANIIEAQAASSKKDFIKFFQIALKSSNETKYWLCMMRDSGILDSSGEVGKLLQEAVEISSILGSSLLTLKGKKKL